jgi:hypothetical protein
MYAESVVFGEALYSGAPVMVTEAFNMMKTVTLGCLTSPLNAADRAELLAMRQVGGDSITPDIEASAADEAELLAIGPVGDDSVAVKVKWYLSPSKTVYDIFRLAIVRDGTRLLIVEEHETVRPSDDPPRVTDAEFAAVVQTAANRLKP